VLVDGTLVRPISSAAALHGQIARKGEKTPIQASGRWHVERDSHPESLDPLPVGHPTSTPFLKTA
jgi:hypothetical protein